MNFLKKHSLRNSPRSDSRYQWTSHVVGKMRYYQLSEGRVRRIVTSPKRVEEGIAPGTVAAMQPGTGKRKEEVWVMYQIVGAKSKGSGVVRPARQKRIITAWRYPGVSKPRASVPVPPDILDELEDLL